MHIRQEPVSNCASRESQRTLDDHQVFLSGINIGLLKSDVGITLVSGNKTGSHLYARRSEFQELINICATVYPSRSDHRNIDAMLFAKGDYRLHNFGDKLLKSELRPVNLVGMKAKMASGHRSLNHKSIRKTIKPR